MESLSSCTEPAVSVCLNQWTIVLDVLVNAQQRFTNVTFTPATEKFESWDVSLNCWGYWIACCCIVENPSDTQIVCVVIRLLFPLISVKFSCCYESMCRTRQFYISLRHLHNFKTIGRLKIYIMGKRDYISQARNMTIRIKATPPMAKSHL